MIFSTLWLGVKGLILLIFTRTDYFYSVFVMAGTADCRYLGYAFFFQGYLLVSVWSRLRFLAGM